MLRNTLRDTKPAIFQAMELFPKAFYLTGSRFFGTPELDSDYDYFIEDSSDVREFLEEMGFHRQISTKADVTFYNDRNCSAVYRYIAGSGLQIDVQLVDSLSRKITAQDAILRSGIESAINSSIADKELRKRLIKHVWDMAYRCIAF